VNRNNRGSYSLPKSKILRGRKNFQRLFTEGATLYCRFINLRYVLLKDDTSEFLMAFIVAKKHGNAVQRNKTKRLLREAYRLNQDILPDISTGSVTTCHAALMTKRTKLTFEQVETDVVVLLKKVKEKLKQQ